MFYGDSGLSGIILAHFIEDTEGIPAQITPTSPRRTMHMYSVSLYLVLMIYHTCHIFLDINIIILPNCPSASPGSEWVLRNDFYIITCICFLVHVNLWFYINYRNTSPKFNETGILSDKSYTLMSDHKREETFIIKEHNKI